MGELFILIVALVLFGIVGIAGMYLVKRSRLQDGIFYLTAFFAMMVAAINATSAPMNYAGQIMVAWVIGAIAVAGIIVKFTGKYSRNNMPKHLVAASVILGLVYLMF